MTIALCFLTLGDLSQPVIWEAFLAEAGGVSVYCHPKHPEEVSTDFLRRGIIADRVATAHAQVSLVDATLNLFRAAYADARNQHFILLSETTVPIVTLADVERDLSGLPGKSIISYRIPASGTEHFRRQAALPADCRFDPFFEHDQWVVLSRKHVSLLFEKPKLQSFARMFAPDEHYFMNVLAHHCGVRPDEVQNRRKTFVNWKEREVREVKNAAGQLVKRTVHPRTYDSLTSSDVLQARGMGCWFFRKVSRRADCGGLLNFVR
jgi:hypothetical protein